MSPAARPARLGTTGAGLGEAGLGDAGRTRTGTASGPHPAGRADELAALLAAHVDRLNRALPALQAATPTLARWGEDLGHRLLAGNRLLAAGNGGSAAEAQHLTAELVGRFDGDRRPLSAIALHADTSSLSAITSRSCTPAPARAHPAPCAQVGCGMHERGAGRQAVRPA